jgi:hypothetical protein
MRHHYDAPQGMCLSCTRTLKTPHTYAFTHHMVVMSMMMVVMSKHQHCRSGSRTTYALVMTTWRRSLPCGCGSTISEGPANDSILHFLGCVNTPWTLSNCSAPGLPETRTLFRTHRSPLQKALTFREVFWRSLARSDMVAQVTVGVQRAICCSNRLVRRLSSVPNAFTQPSVPYSLTLRRASQVEAKAVRLMASGTNRGSSTTTGASAVDSVVDVEGTVVDDRIPVTVGSIDSFVELCLSNLHRILQFGCDNRSWQGSGTGEGGGLLLPGFRVGYSCKASHMTLQGSAKEEGREPRCKVAAYFGQGTYGYSCWYNLRSQVAI